MRGLGYELVCGRPSRVVLCVALAVVAACLAVGCTPREAIRATRKPQTVSPGWPAARTVTLPYRAYGSACVVGDALYVSVDSGGGEIDTVMKVDMGSEETRTVFASAAGIVDAYANDRWIVWESDNTLYAEPIDGGARSVLSTGSEMFAPALEGDVAAWVDRHGGEGGSIVTHDLKRGTRREVGRTHLANFYNNFMQIRDGKLLWTDIYGGTGHYLVHDLSSGKTVDYPAPRTRFRYPGYAKSSGEAIYSITFDRYDEWDWTAQQVGRYSTEAREYTPVTNDGESVNALVAGRDAIGIIDSEQRLLVGPADGSRPAVNLSTRWGTLIDRVQVSSDGQTAVAGVSSSEKRETRLFIFELRAPSSESRLDRR